MVSNKSVIAKFLYGQLVIGPPGSGKTTYCHEMNKYLNSIDRKCIIVNLDPGNENMEYNKPEIDIMDLITLSETMEICKLGPNGALVYCMEYLENNIEWLLSKLNNFHKTYFLFDCPGQVELYTHHKSMTNIFSKLTNVGYRLCSINLIDSHYCSEPTKFISALLLSLNTMLTMALPHINVLSKADLLKQYKKELQFSLDFYTDVLDLQYLLDVLDLSFSKKYKKLNAAIVSMVENYGLVNFQPLNVHNITSLLNMKSLCDKTNGYIFCTNNEITQTSLMACAVGAKTETERYAENVSPYME